MTDDGILIFLLSFTLVGLIISVYALTRLAVRHSRRNRSNPNQRSSH